MSNALQSRQFWNLAHQASERPYDEILLGALADHVEDTEPETLRAHLIRHGNPQHFAVPRGGMWAHGEPGPAGIERGLDPYTNWVQHGWGSPGTPPTAEHAERVTLRGESVPRDLIGVWQPNGPYAPIATVHTRGKSGAPVETYEAFRASHPDNHKRDERDVPVLRYTLHMPRRTLRLVAPVTREHLLALARYASTNGQYVERNKLLDLRRMYSSEDEGENEKTDAYHARVAHKLARAPDPRLRASPEGEVGGDNLFYKTNQFLPKTRRRIRDVAARLMKLARASQPKTPAPAAQEAMRDWVEKLGVLPGVYGLPGVKKAYAENRRLSPGEVDYLENLLEMPNRLRLSKNRRSDVAERMLWLNWIHDSLNGELGLSKLLKNPKLPEPLRVLFHKANKLGAILHFHPAWKQGNPDALDPLEWYDKTMNPMHVAFHESFAPANSDHPLWGRLDEKREKLDDRGGRPLWEHAPAQALAGAVVGLTSPGFTPRMNGNIAFKIVHQAVSDAKKAGTDQWVDHLPESQHHALAAWLAEHKVDHPSSNDSPTLLAWLADLKAHHPKAAEGNAGYKSRALVLADGNVVGTPDPRGGIRFFGPEGLKAYSEAKAVTHVAKVPLTDPYGRLQPKEWSTNQSVSEGIRTLKRVMNHVRTLLHVKTLPAGSERTKAEMHEAAKWLLTHHPVAEVEGVAGRKLNLGFRRDEPTVYGSSAVGPKVGEFIAGLSGPEHADTHVQDMHEARRAEVVQGTTAVTPTGKYNDAKTVSYPTAKRRVLRAAAGHALAYLQQHHPDHPILKLKNNTRAVQALEWIAQKSLVDPDGLLDFHSEKAEVGGPNSDYVSSANDILKHKYGRPVFAPSGKRVVYKREKPPTKPGLAQRADESPERLSRPEDALGGLPPLWLVNSIAQKMAAAGLVPTPYRLVQALLAAMGKGGDRLRLARPAVAPTTPEHVAYVSSSTREDSKLPDAVKGMSSEAAERQRRDAMLLPTVRSVHPGLGFWKDGAEESNSVHVGDPQYLARVGAELGRAYGQKAVLTFREDHSGPDARHLIIVPETDPEKIHADMMRHGIEYKTLVPVNLPDGAKGTRVEAVDGGDQMRPEFDGYAKEAGALSHQVRAGHASVIGGDTRDEAKKAFEGVIANGGTV